MGKQKEDMKAMRENMDYLDQGEVPCVPGHSDVLTDSPSPPPLSQDNKLPSFKLACSVKRSLSPDDDRSPFLPMMNHSSKRLAGGPKPSSQPITSLTKHYDGLG